MKAVADTLGVSRSNLIERLKGKSKPRGPYHKVEDAELLPTIRRLVDQRPTYGYRRIAALLNRERRAADKPAVNAKRVHRIMGNHAMLLEKHTAVRKGRIHDGKVMVMRSNLRWCSDGLEFTCWNGETVRIAFALDCHDREIIGWLATTSGISGEMIRDMMVQCVERRFGSERAPHKVQWLTDNGSVFAAQKTIDIAVALNLEPCFTPVESPESNGMAEAFVKTFKRDYVRLAVIRDAHAALGMIEGWIEDYNSVHPHSRLGYRSPREYIAAQSQPAACPV